MEGPGEGRIGSQGFFLYSNKGRPLHGLYHKANTEGQKLLVSWAA